MRQFITMAPCVFPSQWMWQVFPCHDTNTLWTKRGSCGTLNIFKGYLDPFQVAAMSAGWDTSPWWSSLLALLYQVTATSFWDTTQVDLIYGYPILRWVGETWQHDRVQRYIVLTMATRRDTTLVPFFLENVWIRAAKHLSVPDTPVCLLCSVTFPFDLPSSTCQSGT